MRKVLRVALWVLLLLLVALAVLLFRNRYLIQRTLLGGVKVYETTPPQLPADIKRPAILVFSKTNGFRHEEAIPAGNAFFARLAKEKGWGYYQTENGATFSPALLARFDAVVFNNASGDIFTPQQRAAFRRFVENGGGFVGIHAAGDNSHAAWDWYMNDILGATFIGHPMDPQFQKATVTFENRTHPVSQGLPRTWQHTDEWYAFDKSPRAKGYGVIASVDEKTYKPVAMWGKDLRMGDHPVIWWHCQGKGRTLYTALGHTAEAFAEPNYKLILTNATLWALRLQGDQCGGTGAGREPAQ